MKGNEIKSVGDKMLEEADLLSSQATPSPTQQSAPPSEQQSASPEELNPVFKQPEFQQAATKSRRTEEEEGLRTIGRKIKSGVAALTGKFGDIQSFVEDLVSLPSGKTAEQNRELLRQYGLEPQGGRLPNTQEVKQAIEKRIPSLKAENEDELKQEEGEEFFVNLMGGGAGRSLLNKLTRAGVGSYAAMKGAEALKEQGFSPTVQEIAKVLLGLISQVGRTGRLNPRTMTRQQRIVYEAAQRAGLNAEETTPLLQDARAARSRGARTSETEANRVALEGAERGTGRFLTQVEQRGNVVPIPQNEVTNLERLATDLRDRLQNVYGREPQAQRVVDYLDSIIHDLGTGPHDAGRLMRTFRAINRQFHENVPHLMNLLQPYNRRITRVITRINPDLGRDFRLGNRLFESRINFIRNVGWDNLEHSWTHGSPAQNLLATIGGGIAGAAVGHPVGGAVAGGGSAVALTAWNWLHNQFLMNPRWQNIRQETMNALRQDSTKLAHNTMKTIQERVRKENPEAYEEIDWPK